MSSDRSPKRPSIDDLTRELESAHLRIHTLEKALAEGDQAGGQRQEKFRTAIENEAFLVQSAEMAQLGYAVWDDILDKDVSVSEELARIHGLTSEEYRKSIVSMEKYLEFVVPEDREKYMAYENQFSADLSNKIASVEYCIKRSDGEFRYLHQRSQYVSSSSGKPTQSIVVIQDITDQKQVGLRLQRSRKALEESEAMLSQSAAMANLGHSLWDHSGDKYITVSDRWAAIHGYSKAEYLEKFTHLENDEKLIHPEDLERYIIWIENRDEQEIEYRIIRSDGKVRHLLERFESLFNDSGELTRELLTILDITDRIERENELNEARSAAEQASVAKSSFLAVMSHEIRTPLNAVLGAFGLIESKDLDPTARKFLNVGKKGAESLLLIVNDILDFSKIEAGKLQLEPALFNVQQSIDDVLQVLEPRALEKSISLSGNLGTDVPEFLIGDASRIRQVLLNLCSNAVRFTSTGGVTISLSQIGLQGELTHIRFQVADTGLGVPLADQKHLFEEFWGTNATARDNTGSTGLGLPISMQLVEMMGGLIGFESEPGHGSTFWFELPLEMADVEAVTAEKSKSKSLRKIVPYGDLPSLQGRVLLAEDNPANQLIGQTILERIGLHVGVAANGHEVIESLRSVPYDLILMDINMPEMDGIEATAAIRQLPGSLASTPIIAMTAQAMPGDRERFLSLGMDGYVSKPIKRRELYECISGTLNSHDLPSVNTSDANSTEMSGTGMTIIDANVLGTLKENVGAELLPQIIDTYVSELSARIEAITAAAKCGDCELVTAEAHPLKSSSAYFGAVALAELANQLERAGRECDLDAIRQGALHLPQVSSQTKETLLIALSNLQSSAPESE
jgi:PAS domain S-box-containing protein